MPIPDIESPFDRTSATNLDPELLELLGINDTEVSFRKQQIGTADHEQQFRSAERMSALRCSLAVTVMPSTVNADPTSELQEV